MSSLNKHPVCMCALCKKMSFPTQQAKRTKIEDELNASLSAESVEEMQQMQKLLRYHRDITLGCTEKDYNRIRKRLENPQRSI